MRVAHLVLGPESSGTRLVTRILIKAGAYGHDTHEQSLDWNPPPHQGSHNLQPEELVWRRSLPHDNLWPDLAGMVRELRREGYLVRAIFTDREDEAMAKSQVREHCSRIEVAHNHIERARQTMETFEGASGCPVTHVQYEQLIAHPLDMVMAIIDRMGLQHKKVEAIVGSLNLYNANAAYDELGEG